MLQHKMGEKWGDCFREEKQGGEFWGSRKSGRIDTMQAIHEDAELRRDISTAQREVGAGDPKGLAR